MAEGRDEALFDMLEAVEDIDDYEIITLFVGIEVDADDRVRVTEALEEKYPMHEIVVYEGKQELYDYYVAIE